MRNIIINNKMGEKSFFGFESIGDFINSLFGIKTWVLNFIVAATLGITGFIQNWIYDSAGALYTLWILMLADWITGCVKASRKKEFVSSRFWRMILYYIATTFLIGISWNISHFNLLFHIVPGFVLGGFYSVYFISLAENLGELNLLPKKMVLFLKKIMGLKVLVDKYINKNKEENEKFDSDIENK